MMFKINIRIRSSREEEKEMVLVASFSRTRSLRNPRNTRNLRMGVIPSLLMVDPRRSRSPTSLRARKAWL
jgi:hypothetical protein